MKYAYKIRLVIASAVFILAILGIFGIFYPLKIFDIQFTPVLQKAFVDFSLLTSVLLGVVVLLTLLFGRFYCSLICPFGIFQELAALIFRRKNKTQKNYPFKYFIAAVCFGVLTGGSALVIRYLDPYTLFGSAMTLSLAGIVAAVVVLSIVFFKNRFFCSNICPVGTLLGLLSKYSLNKIYLPKDICVSCGKCATNCPTGSINPKDKTVDNETCIKCLKCLDSCPRHGVQYGIEKKVPVKFSIKRRSLILASSAVVLFGAALKAGIEFKNKISEKISEIILPPGGGSPERFLNKCINCNLCVEHCPQKIIKKADNKFGAVYIDYSNNFCKYDCHECSRVCPSGAIKRLTLDEKKKTRIAMAYINNELCTKCGICAIDCPAGAISKKDGEFPVLDASKCIGCGACKNACKFDAIEIFAVKEQRVI
ncbi:MAG TPA: 4Fe-4S binding protein [Candidatus Adamsella sp.]|nr:4Fe-4S binding protein [Candidatus Adamsella sp.]